MEETKAGLEPSLSPSPSNVKIDHSKYMKYAVVSRTGVGKSGQHISLVANHFKVDLNSDQMFYQYNVFIGYDDKRAISNKATGRKIMNKIYDIYSSELAEKRFAYDGEKSLYTLGPLPRNKLEFTVVLEEPIAICQNPSSTGCPDESGKRSRHTLHSRSFKVEISFSATVSLNSISLALQGTEPDHIQDALRILDIILREEAAKRGCLLVRQSFFHDDSRNFTDIGGGLLGCRGFHSSFHPTCGGLSLNMDVSTTIILTPGPVVDFLMANQNTREPRYIDWAKAKRILRNLRIKATHTNMEFKIIGLSEKPCNQQMFSLKKRKDDDILDQEENVDISVYDYFTKHRNIELTFSAYLPCLNVGKPKRPNYLPLELCSLVSLQRYIKTLSPLQRASLVQKARQKPLERIQVVTEAISSYRYEENPLLAACGISVEKQLMQVDGRVLEAPKLKVGKGEDCVPQNGRWSFNNKQFLSSVRIKVWAVVNFSARCDTSLLSRELINCGMRKGVQIERPQTLVEEDPQNRRADPNTRVQKMFEQLMPKTERPQFLLCVLPERKNSELYGPWKKYSLCKYGIATQCMSPPLKLSDQYLSNLLLKINAKLGGTNSLLAIEHASCVHMIKDTPTMILGMDVSHGSPGQPDIPSVVAVVGSRFWPLISKYRAAVRTQPSKMEMIQCLFKPTTDGEDDGIMRELLLDFYETSKGRKPTQIVVFRDGVSESQFGQVLDIELDQMIKAYEHLGEVNIPKFTVIVAQKNHHTKLFRAGSADNVPPGTVVDTKVVHPRNYDFYMCAHAGMMGTTRPAHYHVLLDQIGFSPDDLQNLVHSLSYVYQRSTTATSVVAPIRYAHLAANQMGQFLSFEELSEASLGQEGITSEGSVPIPELPTLHEDVEGSMFFC